MPEEVWGVQILPKKRERPMGRFDHAALRNEPCLPW